MNSTGILYLVPLFLISSLITLPNFSSAYGESDRIDKEFDSYGKDHFNDEFRNFSVDIEEKRKKLMHEFEKKQITLQHDLQVEFQNLERNFQDSLYNLELDFYDKEHSMEESDGTKYELLDRKIQNLHQEYDQKRNDLERKFHDLMEKNRMDFEQSMRELHKDFETHRMQIHDKFTDERIMRDNGSFDTENRMDYVPSHDRMTDDKYFDMDKPEFREMKLLKERILSKFSMEEIQDYWENGDRDGLLSEILARTDLTEEQVRKMFDFVDNMEKRNKDKFGDYSDDYRSEHETFDNVNRDFPYNPEPLDEFSHIQELETRINELEQENHELHNYIGELEKKIDGFNKVIVEQMQVIYDWVSNHK